MNPLFNVSKSEYYNLQGSPSPGYREPCDESDEKMKASSKIVCSKTVLDADAHIWTLKGSNIFHKVTICAYSPGTLRVEGGIRASFIQDNFEHFKTKTIPQLGQFGKKFFAGQINSGAPKPIKEISDTAEALLNVVCKVEGLANGSFKFMLDQFIDKVGESEDVIVKVAK